MTATTAISRILPSSRKIATSERTSCPSAGRVRLPFSGRLSRGGFSPLTSVCRPMSAAAAAAEDTTSMSTAVEALPIAEELLDGGEVVILAVRPSVWFVLFDSARWILMGLLLLIVSALPTAQLPGLSSRSVAQLGCMVILARLGIAVLRWVAHFYVLTNRRIMRLRGVFKADILSCPLKAISDTRVSVEWHEQMTNLGSILFASEDMPDADLNWYSISRCEEIHDQVRRAITRAKNNQTNF